MTTYVSPFTGDVVQPTDVSYYALAFSANVTLSWPDQTIPGGTTVAAARIMDCTPSTSGLIVSLPAGDQASVGTDILFRNLGASSFTVRDSVGGQSIVIGAGQAFYTYLTNNSTPAGTYANFQFGTGTSTADAATLVGAGLANLAGKLTTSNEIIKTSNNITFSAADRALTYVWQGGLGTASLPTSASITTGWYVMFRNSGSGAVTLSPPAGRTINGSSSIILFPSDSAIIVCDFLTGNYFTIGLTKQTAIAYTAATYDVDSIPTNTLDLSSFAPTIQTYVAPTGTRTQTLTVELPAITQIYIINNDTGYSTYDIEFIVSGSAGTPAVVPNGVTSILLTDGSETYILTQTTTNVFAAADGSVSAPSFTFLNDTGTGLYLNATDNMRIASNGVDMMDFNATNTGDLQIATAAQFNAGLIAGGTF
jgi:hypothetical protein